MTWFSCKHPLAALAVQKEHTATPIDEDFERVTYHFHCTHCRQQVDVSHARTRGGVEAWIKRCEQRAAAKFPHHSNHP